MNAYNKIIAGISVFSSARMMIGSISAVYIVQHGASIADLGYIKSFQAAVLLLFGFFAVLVYHDACHGGKLHVAARTGRVQKKVR